MEGLYIQRFQYFLVRDDHDRVRPLPFVQPIDHEYAWKFENINMSKKLNEVIGKEVTGGKLTYNTFSDSVLIEFHIPSAHDGKCTRTEYQISCSANFQNFGEKLTSFPDKDVFIEPKNSEWCDKTTKEWDEDPCFFSPKKNGKSWCDTEITGEEAQKIRKRVLAFLNFNFFSYILADVKAFGATYIESLK